MTIPPRDAVASLVLLALLALAVLLEDEAPGAGPLALATSVAAGYAALLAPSLASGAPGWGLLPLLLALPALCATSYGHPGAGPLLWSLVLVALAAAAGTAARVLRGRPSARLYLPFMVLLFAAPYALRYLVLEFGRTQDAEGWRLLSPWAAAEQVAGGGGPPAGCVLLLLAWPVWALARRGA
ncbi:MAG: hypothetical protein ACYS0K_07375 [Planctomycetota bacterium]